MIDLFSGTARGTRKICQTMTDKQSGRPHEHLNLSMINKNTFYFVLSSLLYVYFSMFTFSLLVALKLVSLLDNQDFLESLNCLFQGKMLTC